jgi:hypothetical protein
MRDLFCGHMHPDDYGPIQRICRRHPAHDGPHRMLPDHSHYQGPVDQWDNHQEDVA